MVGELVHTAESRQPNKYKTERPNYWRDGQIKNWRAEFDLTAEYWSIQYWSNMASISRVEVLVFYTIYRTNLELGPRFAKVRSF